jgi:hypothetical protein
MEDTAEIAPDGMIYLPSLMKIGWGFQVLLRLLLPHYEWLPCWYY